ncbi:integrase core domain-containing protein [Ktedonospora formicarum]|uniref:integrase core domain-containing protein n=1 Tax=Ktedonospora formicarum TaxID=2778364 RepID=UPI001C688661
MQNSFKTGQLRHSIAFRSICSHQHRISGQSIPNSYAESLIKTLKTEEIFVNKYRNLEDARTQIKPFLMIAYNQRRLHSALASCPPDKFEQRYYQQLLT